MKTVIKMNVYFRKYSYDKAGAFVAYSFRTPDTANLTLVCEQDIEFDVPENYDPTAQKIAALQARKAKAQEDFNNSVFQINELISKLQALEYTSEPQ
jgi:hypothetical protein